MEFTSTSLVSVILASAVPISLIVGYFNRKQGREGQGARGIGTQFIRYTVLAIALPIVGVLAFNGLLSGEVAAALIGGAVGYSFGKNDQSP